MAKARRRRRTGLRGVMRTCLHYKRVRSESGKYVLRCADFVGRKGCPPYVGQKHKAAECTWKSTYKRIRPQSAIC